MSELVMFGLILQGPSKDYWSSKTAIHYDPPPFILLDIKLWLLLYLTFLSVDCRLYNIDSVIVEHHKCNITLSNFRVENSHLSAFVIEKLIVTAIKVSNFYEFWNFIKT